MTLIDTSIAGLFGSKIVLKLRKMIPIRVMTQVSISLNSNSIHTMHSHLNLYKASISSQSHNNQAVNSNYTQLHPLNSLNTINY